MTHKEVSIFNLPEARLFFLAYRQITRRTGAQVVSKATRAMMAATGQDIVQDIFTRLSPPNCGYLGWSYTICVQDLGQISDVGRARDWNLGHKVLRLRFGITNGVCSSPRLKFRERAHATQTRYAGSYAVQIWDMVKNSNDLGTQNSITVTQILVTSIGRR